MCLEVRLSTFMDDITPIPGVILDVNKALTLDGGVGDFRHPWKFAEDTAASEAGELQAI